MYRTSDIKCIELPTSCSAYESFQRTNELYEEEKCKEVVLNNGLKFKDLRDITLMKITDRAVPYFEGKEVYCIDEDGMHFVVDVKFSRLIRKAKEKEEEYEEWQEYEAYKSENSY